MSDREGGDDDVGLPKATVFKLIQGKLRTIFLIIQMIQNDVSHDIPLGSNKD
jgi:hypothetical protein